MGGVVAIKKARSCTVGGCANAYLARGMCGMHYQRVRMRGTVELPGDDRATSCEAPDCSRTDMQGRNYCHMHYFRWYRHGSLEPLRPKRSAKGVCIIGSCGNADDGPHGLCPMHSTRKRRHGDALIVKKPEVRRGVDHPSWTGDDATYSAVHQRLRKSLGSASSSQCVDCGGDAAQWSYDRKDSAELESEFGPYSTDLSYYIARCIPCHKRFDLEAIRNG